jgi:hypothetical protein
MSTQHWFKARIHELDRDDCLDLLQSTRLGRIVFTDQLGPSVLPVNYVLDGTDILVATTAYGVIAKSAPGTRVAFEIDDVDPSNESGWSVIVRGRADSAEHVLPPPDRAAWPQPWAEGARTFIVRIRPDSITGRHLIPV